MGTPALPAFADDPIRHLYVHVPFCPEICPFCSFDVVERRSGAVDEYLDALDRDLGGLADRCKLEPDTVYVGGGTPSHLRLAELERLVEIVERRSGWAAAEATLEVHPSTASAERAAAWAGMGFNRLSVGAESFDDDVLRALGRPHDADAGRRTIDWCLAAGAVTSVDVMTAIDGQDVAADLAAAAATGAHHVSAYTLTIEPGTPFDAAGIVVPDERAADTIESTVATLEAAGFARYEVSNYARPGHRCAHNLAYWDHDWFAGIGPSASSMLPLAGGGVMRLANARTNGAEAECEVLDGPDLMGDMLLCGLRRTDGVDLDRVAVRSGLDPRSELADELGRLAAGGLVEVAGSRLRATPAGLMVLDRVAAALL